MGTDLQRAKIEQIYLAYRGLMYAAAYSILGHGMDAEDAVHQAFLKLTENLDRLDDPGSPRTKSFVVIVAENAAIDIYRKRRRRAEVPLEEHREAAPETGDGPDLLAGCIAAMKGKDRQILLLKYRHGYTIGEIAGILALSEAVVAKRLQRAKAKLEKLCAEAGIL